jgi:hypothetical protein
MNLKMGLTGKYTLRVTRPGVGVIRVLEFDNLITDLGLNGIGTNGTSWVTAVALGTGTATPAVGDTSLSGPVVSTTTANGVASGAITTGTGRYGWARFTLRFAQGAATGNWTEVGIGRNSTTLWSRALILDANDNPTTLTILATDILDVDYEPRVYPNEEDVTGTRTIGGIDTDYIVRPMSIGNSSARDMLQGSWMSVPATNYMTYYGTPGVLGANYINPTGSQVSVSTPSVAAYSSGSYRKVVTYSASIIQANTTGGVFACAMLIHSSSLGIYFKCSFSPPIAKDNTKTLTLTFGFTWGRL